METTIPNNIPRWEDRGDHPRPPCLDRMEDDESHKVERMLVPPNRTKGDPPFKTVVCRTEAATIVTETAPLPTAVPGEKKLYDEDTTVATAEGLVTSNEKAREREATVVYGVDDSVVELGAMETATTAAFQTGDLKDAIVGSLVTIDEVDNQRETAVSAAVAPIRVATEGPDFVDDTPLLSRKPPPPPLPLAAPAEMIKTENEPVAARFDAAFWK